MAHRQSLSGRLTRHWVAASDWRQAAAGLAGELAGLADRSEAEAIVMSGDHWARTALTREMPARLRKRVIAVDSDGWDTVPERALLEDELAQLFRGRLSAVTRPTPRDSWPAARGTAARPRV